MIDGHTLACVHKLCVDLSQAEFVEIKASVKATRSKHVAEVVVKVEIGEFICAFSFCKMHHTIFLPHLNLKDTQDTVSLFFFNCCKGLNDFVTFFDIKPSQRWCCQLLGHSLILGTLSLCLVLTLSFDHFL